MASLVPGLDTFADLAAIPVDLMRGDYMSALFDLVGVIPGIGEAGDTAKLARMGIKAGETAGDVIDTARAVETAGDVYDTVKVVETADDVVDAAKAVDSAEVAKSVAKANDFESFPKTIHTGRQGKHIIGHNNYIPGKSIVSVPDDTLEKLVKKYSGTGRRSATNKEVVDFGEIIGQYVDPSTGKTYATTIGTIHCSKDGVHVVPMRPKDRR